MIKTCPQKTQIKSQPPLILVFKLAEMDKIELAPIGIVKRPELSKEEIKDHNLISELEIKSEYSSGLKGINEFSHVYVIFWMHKMTKSSLIAPFSKDPNMPDVGVFATRAPINPNHIGLSLVEIIEYKENKLRVKGLDAYNGTPILDIKPYPNWPNSKLQVVSSFKIPKWLSKIVE